MKALMCYTDKRMKQETQISSMKRRYSMLDVKTEEDREGHLGSFHKEKKN